MEEKKESWMKKLVDLLNHYDKVNDLMYSWEIEWEDIQWYNHFRWGYEMINVGECIIISKRYWFIERLVEKDLIDTHKPLYEWIEWWITDYQKILMLLSIQDEPIQFLCSILK